MIKLVNVSKFYSTNNVIALGLRKVSLELHRNEFVAIVGESGSGKTTLLNVISGIDSYEDGEMYVNGKETSYYSVSDMENYRKKYVAFVFQNYNLIDAYTVLQNVEAPLILSGYPKSKVRERAKEIIRKVGLEDHMHHKATRLSGGQKQRVVIARALAKDCPIIAADEPTGNLDSESAKQIIELLHEISKDRLVIMVTHDFNQVAEYATRKIRIFDGEIVEDRNLKKVKKLDLPEIPDEQHKIREVDYLNIAMRNLLSVPKKTLLMIVVFTFFSFFVGMAYGAYQLVMSDAVNYGNTYFTNTNPNRIVIRKDDNSAFTSDELASLEDYGSVTTVVPFDYVLDYNDQFMTNVVNDEYYGMSGNYLPDTLITQSDLSVGTMPLNDNQIVLALNGAQVDMLSEYVPFTIVGTRFGVARTYQVVGLVDNRQLVLGQSAVNNRYFMVTEDELQNLRKEIYFAYAESVTFDDGTDTTTITPGDSFISVDNSLPDNQISMSSSAVFKSCNFLPCTATVDLSIADYYTTKTYTDINLLYTTSSSSYGNVYFMNQTTLDALTYDEVYQVSLLTDTDIGVNTLINRIERVPGADTAHKYKVVYPYDSQAPDPTQSLVLLLTNIGMIALNVFVLIGSTLITYVIFRAIINTKLPDYAIYRTIGANQRAIKTFIYTENLLVVVVSYVIFLIVSLSLPSSLTDSSIFYALKVFNFGNYIVFFILLVIMSLIISRKYSNRIFRNTVQTTLKGSME